MKNLTNLKKVLTLVIAVAVICLSTSVFAANDFTSLSSSLNNSSSGNSSQAASENSGSNSSSNSGTNSNTSGTTNLSTSSGNNNAATNNSNATSLNSSSYNNTNLPETGLEDTLPVAVLIVVLGISAVYAYKKVKDYQNL